MAGVVGPLAFVADWAVLGATRRGYSPVEDAISRLAETGAATRPAMTAGFVVYGTGLCLFSADRRLPTATRRMVAATGLTTYGVAVFALGTPTSGRIHAVFAGLGYATLALAPLVTVRSLAARGERGRARLTAGVGALTGALLLASAVGPAHGLTQRAGLTLGDAWVVAAALGAWTA